MNIQAIVNSKNNETLAFSLGLSLPNETFPIDDIVWHAQVRDSANQVALDFTTLNGRLSVNAVDNGAKTLTLSFVATPDDVAGLLGVYQGDVKMIRGSRKIVIADLALTFLAGETQE